MDYEDSTANFKLQRETERQMKLSRDKYSTEQEPEDENLYKHILNADIRIAPKKGQLLADYVKELQIYVQMASKKNIQIHIIKGVRGKPWYTHLRGDGCFMCEDMNMIHAMLSSLRLIADNYPKAHF